MDTIGYKIKELRLKKGLTQEQLAQKLYVSDKTISSWECDRTIPDINTLFQITNILDTNIYNILTTNYNNVENLEIEVKLKVSLTEFERIKGLFDKNEAKEYEIIDDYYVPSFRKFDNEWFRIRKEMGKSLITYKKKIVDNCCEEYEVLIDDVNKFQKIIENLGFNKKGTITKTRTKIMYQDKYEFAFDNVENLGTFIEIEVKKIEKDNIDEIKDLMKLLNKFNIDISLVEQKRYFDYL